MPRDWNIDTLREWDEKIREKAEEFGLQRFPQALRVRPGRADGFFLRPGSVGLLM